VNDTWLTMAATTKTMFVNMLREALVADGMTMIGGLGGAKRSN